MKDTLVEARELVRSEGTLVVFAGTAMESGDDVLFVVEHSQAREVSRGIRTGHPLVAVPAWAIMREEV